MILLSYDPSFKDTLEAWQYLDLGFTLKELRWISDPSLAIPHSHLFPSTSSLTRLDLAGQAILSWLSPTTKSILREMTHQIHVLHQ